MEGFYNYSNMARIVLYTFMQALPERCFDLSRDTAIHLLSTQDTQERVVAGRCSGLFELNDDVTWEAIHLGIKQRLRIKITGFDRPFFFEDTMQKGAFKSMRHEHHFCLEKKGTRMTDIFEYEIPFGFLGHLFDRFYLKN